MVINSTITDMTAINVYQFGHMWWLRNIIPAPRRQKLKASLGYLHSQFQAKTDWRLRFYLKKSLPNSHKKVRVFFFQLYINQIKLESSCEIWGAFVSKKIINLFKPNFL